MTQAYLESMVLGHVLLQLCPGLQLATVGTVYSVLEGVKLMKRRLLSSSAPHYVFSLLHVLEELILGKDVRAGIERSLRDVTGS